MVGTIRRVHFAIPITTLALLCVEYPQSKFPVRLLRSVSKIESFSPFYNILGFSGLSIFGRQYKCTFICAYYVNVSTIYSTFEAKYFKKEVIGTSSEYSIKHWGLGPKFLQSVKNWQFFGTPIDILCKYSSFDQSQKCMSHFFIVQFLDFWGFYTLKKDLSCY